MEDPKINGVVFGDIIGGIQKITVEEKNQNPDPDRITVILITNVTENLIVILPSGLSCHPKLESNESDPTQKRVVIDRFDFEELREHGGVHTMGLDLIGDGDVDNNKQRVTIDIINIDDEVPNLNVYNCTMNENDVNTNCTFKISDPDGFLDSIKFNDISGEGSEMFEFKYNKIPEEDSQESDVIFGLKPNLTLDYEKQNFYTLQVKITDNAGHNTVPFITAINITVNNIPEK